ncbi:MAG TPA: YciI family protein [Candidatus Limnocylindrales bacterium]|nr:YciI family protein [Candidatus Limnocylindrales bacterium]
MLLLHRDRAAEEVRMPEQNMAALAAHMAFAAELRQSGAMLGGDELQPASSARTVHLNPPAPMISDGPFAETREQLGGYYLIEARDMDEAVKWAAKVPAPGGSVEVRPISTYA